MRNENEYLAKLPFDIYELSLFQMVAACGSFTKAAAAAGLSQSAVTRQIQGIESQLGVALFERTTRRVILTSAGRFLLDRAEGIVSDVGRTFRELQENFATAPKTLCVGVSRSIGLAYLPGFFAAYRQKHPGIRSQVMQQSSSEILRGLESNAIQAGILCSPERLPAGVKIAHRFPDEFVLIAPALTHLPEEGQSTTGLLQTLAGQDWILLNDGSNTGRKLRTWLAELGANIRPAMEADSFDLIVNLVAMGMGISIVPHRALALYPKARTIQRRLLRPKFSRDLVVVVRKDRNPPEHLTQFIHSLLFGRATTVQGGSVGNRAM